MLQYKIKKSKIAKNIEDAVKNLNNSGNLYKMNMIEILKIVPVHNAIMAGTIVYYSLV